MKRDTTALSVDAERSGLGGRCVSIEREERQVEPQDDQLRKERDAARAAIREMNERHGTPLGFYTDETEEQILVSNAAAAPAGARIGEGR